jgi:trk system potassium uptake protein TrkA
VASLLEHSSATEVVEYGGGKLTMVRVPVADGAPVVGKELRDLVGAQEERTYVIVAIQREARTVVPHGDDVVQGGDEIIAICRRKNVRDVTFLAGQRDEKMRKVMILGGGDVGLQLARRLERMKVSVVLIEREKAACARLNELLDRTLVLQGDGTDIALLTSEGVAEMDAFVALTPDEENNILASLMARHHGCRKVITLIRRPDYVSVMPSIGIDAAVSKRISTVSGILRYVRRGSILSVTLFQDTDAEAIEMRASKGSVMVGLPLSRIRFPRKALVGAVIREGSGSGEVEVASGSTVIEPGDRVVVFALKDAVGKVEELFG